MAKVARRVRYAARVGSDAKPRSTESASLSSKRQRKVRNKTSEKVARELRQLIIKQAPGFQPGQLLKPKHLEKQVDASPETIRRALKRLRNEGLVEHSQGNRVTPIAPFRGRAFEGARPRKIKWPKDEYIIDYVRRNASWAASEAARVVMRNTVSLSALREFNDAFARAEEADRLDVAWGRAQPEEQVTSCIGLQENIRFQAALISLSPDEALHLTLHPAHGLTLESLAGDLKLVWMDALFRRTAFTFTRKIFESVRSGETEDARDAVLGYMEEFERAYWVEKRRFQSSH